MKNFIFSIIMLSFTVNVFGQVTGRIDPSKCVGSWLCTTDINALKNDMGCLLDVNFRLDLFSDNRFQIEILEFGGNRNSGNYPCTVLVNKHIWDTFIANNKIVFNSYHVCISDNIYYLCLNISGLNDPSLRKTKQDVERVEILQLDDSILKLRIGASDLWFKRG